MDKYIIRR